MKKIDLNLEWYSPSIGAPTVSIANYGITFSKAAVEELGNPVAVKIGFDSEKKIIAIKPLNRNMDDSFEFADRNKNGYVRINNKGFIRMIRTYCDYSFKKTRKFIGQMDNENNLLTIDLNNPADIDLKEEK